MHALLALVITVTLTLIGCAGCTPKQNQGDAPMPTTSRDGSVKLTVLYDNFPQEPRLRTDWGFACLVEGLEKTILFDTGERGEILLANMRKLGKRPEDIDIIVLSHEHSDHTGGLGEFLAAAANATVYGLASFPETIKKTAKAAGARFTPVTEAVKVCDHAFSTGEVSGRINEEALVIETAGGLVALTGCAHPGIVKMVQAAKEVAPGDVRLVMGGFHMRDDTEAEVLEVIQQLKDLGVRQAAPSHCSGEHTREIFAREFGDDYIASGLGAVVSLPSVSP